MKLRIVVVCSLLLSGCASLSFEGPFAQFYQDKTNGEDLTKSPHVILPSGSPELLRGDEDADKVRMLEDGFRLIGISSFIGPDASLVAVRNNALAQGEKVHASAVLVYPPKYVGHVDGILNSARPEFDYFVSYWIKIKSLVFGVYVDELSAELKQKIGGNRGVVVVAVLKNSPASVVGILRGDVLKQIGEKEIADKKALSEATSQYAGKKVTVKFLRDGKEFTKEVVLNEK